MLDMHPGVECVWVSWQYIGILTVANCDFFTSLKISMSADMGLLIVILMLTVSTLRVALYVYVELVSLEMV